jgi:hypothetical protein
MALRTWGTIEALNGAIARLIPLQSDVRLSAAEQALCGELQQADQLALNAMNAQGIIPQQGQRNARATQIEDKVHALGIVEANHSEEISPDEFYNAMDLSMDCATAIRDGVNTFISDLGEGL